MRKDKMIVIIGNSVAAIAAVEAIREENAKTEITLVSSEPNHVYSRPMIPGFLYGKYDEKRMQFRDDEFYKRNKVTALLGRKAVKLDEKKKEIFLDDEKKLHYDKLLIATGGVPFIPPMKGAENDLLTFTTLDNAKKLKDEAKEKNDFVVIGAGLIGLKVAESLAKMSKGVKVVELADRILGGIADKKSSEMFLEEFRKHGVEINLKCSVEEILRKDGKITGVRLNDGRTLSCDSFVVAIGVRPNIEIVKGTGIAFNKGIIVNEMMETNVQNIYAAGDCVEAKDIIANENRNLPLWPNASLQGKVAGFNMAEKKDIYPGSYMMNSITFFDLPMISYGLVNAEGPEFEILEKIRKDDYRKIIIRNGKIVGAIFVNNIDRAGIIDGLIRENADISEFKTSLIDDDIGFIVMPAKTRKEKLSSVQVTRL
ncbi:NAD(P)/FAD-dependent oxidoreductase [Candidatus Woesearchaeota archaeon]|nr:NAD(P)/FAD-dependent oxidoreductase [Candidatus Woesearchaeota archaeon]